MLHKFTTVESYTVSLVFHHPLTLSFQALKNLPFLQILPTAGQTTCYNKRLVTLLNLYALYKQVYLSIYLPIYTELVSRPLN